MEELTKRDYPIGVLESLISSRGKQAIDRKLKKYGYGFTSTGSGTKRVYTITSLPNAQARFKSYCVHSLGMSPQTDFMKFREFVFYLAYDEGFSGKPDEMMEEYLRLEGRGMARQTISKYKHYLESLNYIAPVGDFVYYRVSKKYGVQEHEEITKEEYNKAWRYYFEWRNDHPDENSSRAYAYMYSKFKGVPRKQEKIVENAICAKELNTLYTLASDAIMEEIGG